MSAGPSLSCAAEVSRPSWPFSGCCTRPIFPRSIPASIKRSYAALAAIYLARILWLGLVVQDINWIVICLTVALAGVGAVEATVWTTAVELGGSQGGTAAGICNTGGNLGGLVAPVLTPFLSHAVIAQFGVTEQVG